MPTLRETPVFGGVRFFVRVDLKVPFAEKDKAKRLGARWDAAKRVWYVEDKEDLSPFLQWMPDHLRKPHKT